MLDVRTVAEDDHRHIVDNCTKFYNLHCVGRATV